MSTEMPPASLLRVPFVNPLLKVNAGRDGGEAKGDAEPTDCWICMEDIRKEDLVVRPCACKRDGHVECVVKWYMTRCRFAATGESGSMDSPPLLKVTNARCETCNQVLDVALLECVYINGTIQKDQAVARLARRLSRTDVESGAGRTGTLRADAAQLEQDANDVVLRVLYNATPCTWLIMVILVISTAFIVLLIIDVMR